MPNKGCRRCSCRVVSPGPVLPAGVAPGTVVITDKAVDHSFLPQFEQVVLGKVITRSTVLDEDVASELLHCSSELHNVPTVRGNTLCTDDFYEGMDVFTPPGAPSKTTS